jgi:hypothetical protein
MPGCARCPHALKLHQQLIFRASSGGGFQKYQFDSAAREFFGEQNLIRVLTTQAVRRVHQHRTDLAFGCQVAQRFQAGSHQNRAAVALILEDPFRRHGIPVRPRVIDQRRCLAGDRVLFLLPIGRDASINRCRFVHRSSPSETESIQGLGLQPLDAGPGPAVDTPEPASQAANDQNDTPVASCEPRPSSPQLRPPPRNRRAIKARVTTSLIEILLTDAYDRTRRIKLRGSLTVNASLDSPTGTGSFNCSACCR